MVINNPSRKYIFYNRNTNHIHDNIYELINIDVIRKANLQAHENNISKFFSRPDQCEDVIDGIRPIPPRSRWFYDGKMFTCINDKYISVNFKADLSSLLKTLNKLATVLADKKIAVELSGGLDTSIIIGILKHLNFDLYLIGSKSLRYELRTESYIQSYYQNRFQNVNLISSKQTLPFTNLLSAPSHQLPSSSSLYYMFAKRTAQECDKAGVNILLSGMGFDTLLCENPLSSGTNTIPNSWYTWMLDDNWFNEYVYDNYNITYKSAAASQLIIKIIWAIRQLEGEDLKKWWARKFFSPFLPNELVDYAYKADNSGGFLDGFLNARNDISNIFKVAYDITSSKSFSPKSLDELYNNVHLVDEHKDKLILARVSYANWIFGLVRDNKLNA